MVLPALDGITQVPAGDSSHHLDGDLIKKRARTRAVLCDAVFVKRPAHDLVVAVRVEDDLVAAVVDVRPGPPEGAEIR